MTELVEDVRLSSLYEHGNIIYIYINTCIVFTGITKFWTGLHTENDHLVWDDLIPNQVRPHNMYVFHIHHTYSILNTNTKYKFHY